jgi:GNAT superfamily N-acetyltransferase
MSSESATAEVLVRVATEFDAKLLAEFRHELRSSFQQVLEEQVAFVERCTLWMQERLRSGGAWNCWIAEHQKRPVGAVWVQLIEKIPNPVAEAEYYAYLTNFYVREQYRGKGIGSMLLSEALAWSKDKNAETVLLWPTERSKALYERHGFTPAIDFMQLTIAEKSKS